ncbi:MAG: N-acetyl-gamma-glutamyl-phosphate reductase [bacterium]|nr:N-acetyl-gamma-glutamyl-phosphate reductase [bacterium]
MIKVAIVGATGYSGRELIKILIRHPEVEIVWLSGKVEKVTPISTIFPELKGRIELDCYDFVFDNKTAGSADLIFLAVPHRVSMDIAPRFLSLGKKIIDLSADFRLNDPLLYKKWYGVEHKSARLLSEAVYGLPEIYRSQIRGASLIANPGCYPTSVILGLAPLLNPGFVELNSIIVDAKTGISGAGRVPQIFTHYSERNESIKGYKILSHQHTPEIEQELTKLAKRRVSITFVPHLVPMDRGILSTIYLTLKRCTREKDILEMYKDFYDKEPFIRIQDQAPDTKDVLNTNFCDIFLIAKKRQIVIFSVIDNLWKGASSQAIQNMNIMFGFEEGTGLR